MSYLLLIVEPVGQRQARSEKEARHLYQQMLDFEEDLKKRGLFLASSSLRPVAEGVRVRVREGKRAVIDGPFSEAKEMVGGPKPRRWWAVFSCSIAIPENRRLPLPANVPPPNGPRSKCGKPARAISLEKNLGPRVDFAPARSSFGVEPAPPIL